MNRDRVVHKNIYQITLGDRYKEFFRMCPSSPDDPAEISL